MKYYIDNNGLSNNEKKIYSQINDFTFDKINLYQKNKTREWIVGYQTFGIFVVGLCNWIHKSVKERNINKIFFLSRDGYIIKQAYDILYPNEDTNYFYVSRRSLALVSIENFDDIDEVIKSVVLPPIFTIKVLADAFSINYIQFKKKALKFNITENEFFKRSNFINDERLKKLIESMLDNIKQVALEQTSNFTQYIEQEKFIGKIGIVDIGWHNSIQDKLIKIVNKLNYNTQLNGFYVGVYDDAKKICDDNSTTGFLYNYGDNINLQYKTFSFASLFETMFLAHEGTTKSYNFLNNKIKPNLAEYEYSDEIASLEIVSNFQNGAMQFVKDFNSEKTLEYLDLNSNICSRNVIKFGCKTTKEDINIFENLSFENYNKNNIVNFNQNSLFYFTHPKKMIQDFYKSGWRILFLRKLFKIPLPYNFIFKLICTVFSRG